MNALAANLCTALTQALLIYGGLIAAAAGAHAVGGLLSIDFADAASPKVTRLSYLPENAGLVLCLTATGDSHADLNEDYAAVPVR